MNNINYPENHKYINYLNGNQYYSYFQSQNNQNIYYNIFYCNNQMNANNKIQYPIIFNQYNININNNITNNLFNEIYISKNFIQVIKTHHGYQLLKDKILGNPYFVNTLLFPEIKKDLKEICCDFFGSSLIQIMLDLLSYEKIYIFLYKINDSLHDICLSEPGSLAIQKLIEIINKFPVLLNNFIIYLNNKNIEILFLSPYSYHIFIKYLSIVKIKEFTNFIYNYIFNNFLLIIKGKYSVCIVQKCLCEADDNQRKKLFNYILIYLEQIMKDCYGSYIILFIFIRFEKRNFTENLPILSKIEENIIDYCKNKYSSFVIEKFIEKGDKEIPEHILNYILINHPNSIIDILTNQFGFYIIKKSLNIPNQNIKINLMKNIINNLDKLKQTSIINKIITNFSSEYKEFSDLMFLKNKGNL